MFELQKITFKYVVGIVALHCRLYRLLTGDRSICRPIFGFYRYIGIGQ